jgi:peptide/nickel transport system permease protein
MHPVGDDNQETSRPLVLATANKADNEVHESYAQLVWQRFRRSKISLVGVLMVLALAILAIFSAFFSPTDPSQIDLKNSFIPPQRVRFIDAEGAFHWRPFTYIQVLTLDPQTYAPIWTEDTSKRYEIQFFVKGWEYKILGFVPMKIHLFGVEEGGSIYLLGTDKFGRDLWGRSCEAGRISLSLSLFAAFISIAIGSSIGVISGYYGGWTDNLLQRLIEVLQSIPALPLWMALAAIVPITWSPLRVFMVMALIFALLSWTVLAREVRGKIMAFRETDFVMAAKEMGASDRRIIFNHLYPQSLSHIIVILTLAIPEIILAEAFLSFLGLGIQEPLISWGFLMRDAQNIETLGSHPWIMTPAVFIVVAVLGFNFLGDGLRDAADPYSIV